MKKQKSKDLRLMFSSNAIWATSGYSQQIAEFLPLIRDEGYPTALVSFYGLEGAPIEYQGIKCYPKIADVWGGDALAEHGVDFKADVSFTLQDIWVLNPNDIKRFKNWIPIVPIDHDPPPPAVIERLRGAYRIVTYSEFGYKALKELGFHSTMIPHTVNTEIFKKKDRTEIRKKLGIPEDLFLFGMVAANKDNPSRKSFQEVMDAFVMFKKKHPKSGIYFHTLVEQHGGFPIKEYAKFLGIESSVFHIPIYEQLYKVSKELMPNLYNAFDCLLAPSTNGGFEVPIIEAGACEIPVITNNFTAMAELVIEGVTGFKTEVAYKRFTPLLSYIGVPSVQSIYEKMEAMFRADREKMGKAARENVLAKYDTKTVFETKWKPFLATLEKEIKKKE